MQRTPAQSKFGELPEVPPNEWDAATNLHNSNWREHMAEGGGPGARRPGQTKFRKEELGDYEEDPQDRDSFERTQRSIGHRFTPYSGRWRY